MKKLFVIAALFTSSAFAHTFTVQPIVSHTASLYDFGDSLNRLSLGLRAAYFVTPI
jgi:hypothetical protein